MQLARARTTELARAAGVLLVVLAVTAVSLAALDALPRWLRGEDRHVRRYPTVEAAERRLATHVLLPTYFPQTLRWPPSSIRVDPLPPATVALAFDGADGRPAMVLYQSPRAGSRLSPRLRPPDAPLQQLPVTVGAEGGTLSRVVIEDGSIWNEVTWRAGDTLLALRGRGTVDELVAIAKSVRPRP
jgi:hypothetical protein